MSCLCSLEVLGRRVASFADACSCSPDLLHRRFEFLVLAHSHEKPAMRISYAKDVALRGCGSYGAMSDCLRTAVCVCVCASLHSTPFTPPTPLTPFTPLTPLTPLTDRMHVHGCQRIYILRMKNRPETVKVAPLIRNSIACVPVHRLAAWLSPAGIHLPPADFLLLASCSRLLAVARWLAAASDQG